MPVPHDMQKTESFARSVGVYLNRNARPHSGQRWSKTTSPLPL
jgi:hypothetical protein